MIPATHLLEHFYPYLSIHPSICIQNLFSIWSTSRSTGSLDHCLSRYIYNIFNHWTCQLAKTNFAPWKTQRQHTNDHTSNKKYNNRKASLPLAPAKRCAHKLPRIFFRNKFGCCWTIPALQLPRPTVSICVLRVVCKGFDHGVVTLFLRFLPCC